MFLRYNKNTVIETYISQSFELYRDTIVSKHKSQYKEEDIKGESCIQYSIEDIYISILYVSMIYSDVISLQKDWSYFNTKYDLDNTRKCLACKGIDVDDILKVFGLPYDENDGIGYESIEETFEIEPFGLTPIPYNIYDINELLETEDGCTNLLFLEVPELFLETQDDDVFLEIQDLNNPQQLLIL